MAEKKKEEPKPTGKPDEKKEPDKVIDGEFKEHEASALAIRQTADLGIIRPPDVVLAEARAAANALADVIKTKKNPVKFNNEQYLEAEDWTLLGQFYGVAPKTEWTRPVELKTGSGWEARVALIDLRTGIEVGAGEAMCLDTEENWGVRPKYEWMDESVALEKFGRQAIIATEPSRYPGKPMRARVHTADEPVADASRRSMAQTRATSRALAMRLKWIPVLAGFGATPAEDMPKYRKGGAAPSGSGSDYDDPGPPSDAAPVPAAPKPGAPAAPAAAQADARPKTPMDEESMQLIRTGVKYVIEESRKGNAAAMEAQKKWKEWFDGAGGPKSWSGLWADDAYTYAALKILGLERSASKEAAPSDALNVQ